MSALRGVGADRDAEHDPAHDDHADRSLTADDQARLIEEYESEAATRPLGEAWRIVAGAVAITICLYALYRTQYSVATQVYRGTFLLLALVAVFLIFPATPRRVDAATRAVRHERQQSAAIGLALAWLGLRYVLYLANVDASSTALALGVTAVGAGLAVAGSPSTWTQLDTGRASRAITVSVASFAAAFALVGIAARSTDDLRRSIVFWPVVAATSAGVAATIGLAARAVRSGDRWSWSRWRDAQTLVIATALPIGALADPEWARSMLRSPGVGGALVAGVAIAGLADAWVRSGTRSAGGEPAEHAPLVTEVFLAVVVAAVAGATLPRFVGYALTPLSSSTSWVLGVATTIAVLVGTTPSRHGHQIELRHALGIAAACAPVAGTVVVFVSRRVDAVARQDVFWTLLVLLTATLVIGAWRTLLATDRGPAVVDLALIGATVASLAFLCFQFRDALQRVTNPTVSEQIMGAVMIVVVAEATRRTTGWALPIVGGAFLLYALYGPSMPFRLDHRGYDVRRIVGQNFLTLEGVIGVPLDVAATYIILFTIYGAVLEYSGAGKFFIDWSFAALGRSKSPAAPGRTVTAAGFLLGTVSGSGTSTTVTLGSLCWPLLRRARYERNMAGGLLSAAGIGATLSPPTLGAAAFIIAEYLQVSYAQVLVYATIPTILYYLSCLLMMEADTRRSDVQAVDIERQSLLSLTARFGYHFSSLFAIVLLLVAGFTPFMAVFWSIVIAFALSFVRRETRLTSLPIAAAGLACGGVAVVRGARWSESALWMLVGATVAAVLTAAWERRRRSAVASGSESDDEMTELYGPPATRLVRAFESGGRSAVSITATTAIAGFIVSIVTLTGLGLKVAGFIADDDGSLLVTVLLGALAVWVLGLAVPVTASYIIAAVMVVPALTEAGVSPAAAHMFVFYYAVLADVSPPTALAPFAAAAITGGNPFRTTMMAWKYCLPAFLVPFMFTLSSDGESLLLEGEWTTIAVTTATGCVAIAALAVAFGGWMWRGANPIERVISGIAGLCLLFADQRSDLAGVALLATAVTIHVTRVRAGLTGQSVQPRSDAPV
jgi:TRAP transporter 4TM/12TM fusion protein